MIKGFGMWDNEHSAFRLLQFFMTITSADMLPKSIYPGVKDTRNTDVHVFKSHHTKT